MQAYVTVQLQNGAKTVLTNNKKTLFICQCGLSIQDWFETT